jgi:hypothetical protein
VRCPPQTLDEFAEYAETFARENGEPGTLSAQVAEGLRAATTADTYWQRLPIRDPPGHMSMPLCWLSVTL